MLCGPRDLAPVAFGDRGDRTAQEDGIVLAGPFVGGALAEVPVERGVARGGWTGQPLVAGHSSLARVLPVGMIGVTLFFVLSGYLITRLPLEERRDAGFEPWRALGRFYFRRTT